MDYAKTAAAYIAQLVAFFKRLPPSQGAEYTF
jgi:hypothetical protein